MNQKQFRSFVKGQTLQEVFALVKQLDALEVKAISHVSLQIIALLGDQADQSMHAHSIETASLIIESSHSQTELASAYQTLNANLGSARNKERVLSLALGKPLREMLEDQTLWPKSTGELLEQFLAGVLPQQQTEEYFKDLNMNLIGEL